MNNGFVPRCSHLLLLNAAQSTNVRYGEAGPQR